MQISTPVNIYKHWTKFHSGFIVWFLMPYRFLIFCLFPFLIFVSVKCYSFLNKSNCVRGLFWESSFVLCFFIVYKNSHKIIGGQVSLGKCFEIFLSQINWHHYIGARRSLRVMTDPREEGNVFFTMTICERKIHFQRLYFTAQRFRFLIIWPHYFSPRWYWALTMGTNGARGCGHHDDQNAERQPGTRKLGSRTSCSPPWHMPTSTQSGLTLQWLFSIRSHFLKIVLYLWRMYLAQCIFSLSHWAFSQRCELDR